MSSTGLKLDTQERFIRHSPERCDAEHTLRIGVIYFSGVHYIVIDLCKCTSHTFYVPSREQLPRFSDPSQSRDTQKMFAIFQHE